MGHGQTDRQMKRAERLMSRKWIVEVRSLQGRFAPWAEAQGLPSPIHSTGFTPGLKPRPPKEEEKKHLGGCQVLRENQDQPASTVNSCAVHMRLASEARKRARFATS